MQNIRQEQEQKYLREPTENAPVNGSQERHCCQETGSLRGVARMLTKIIDAFIETGETLQRPAFAEN